MSARLPIKPGRASLHPEWNRSKKTGRLHDAASPCETLSGALPGSGAPEKPLELSRRGRRNVIAYRQTVMEVSHAPARHATSSKN
jgi:hypothetical protein